MIFSYKLTEFCKIINTLQQVFNYVNYIHKRNFNYKLYHSFVSFLPLLLVVRFWAQTTRFLVDLYAVA